MLMVALVFATFYSEYLNFYELVNKCTSVRIAVQMDVLKLEGHFLRAKKEKLGMLVHVLRQMLFGRRAWQINI